MISRDVSFSVSGIDFPDGVDPLGLWQVEKYRISSFTVDASPLMTESVWRIQLPDTLEEAQNIMQSQQYNIEQQQHYLDIIESQLADYNPKENYNLSFVTDRDSPLATLQSSITEISAWSTAYNTTGANPDYIRLYEQCETFLGRFKDIMSLQRRIETRTGQNLVGLTHIDWKGDYKTIWEKQATPPAMHLHIKSVNLASTSRMVVLRIISTAVSGALSIAIKAAIPGGQILLIPAVYHFVSDMLRELKNIPVHA